MIPLPSSPRPPAVRLMRHLGLEPDPWQLQVLESDHPRLLLNCCRQAGKSTVVAVLALAEVVFTPDTLVLLLSRSHRQSQELFRKVVDFYHTLGEPLLKRLTTEELVLTDGSRIVSLPCREETIRGYSCVSRLIIDEAARVPDDVYRSVRPMLAVSAGRLVALSTPYGRRGFFYEAWSRGGDDWLRIEVPAGQIRRIRPDFLQEERRQMGESWFRQEYCCSFEALEGLVYPDFARCVVSSLPSPLSPLPSPLGGEGSGVRGGVVPSLPSPLVGEGSKVRGQADHRLGGIDFGFRNPFAAVWGFLDRDDVLWLTGEHYASHKPLDYHIARLPPDVLWYCDPAGAQERMELTLANLKVKKGINDLRAGIMAVTARLESGRLRVLAGACPNLLYEAALYRYGESSPSRGSEAPLDQHNHALAALRYLVSRLDEGRQARRRPIPAPAPSPTPPSPPLQEHWTRRWNDPDLWTRLF